MSTINVPLSALKTREGFNPRSTMEKDELDALTKSVQHHGLIQPLIVAQHDNEYVVVDGHRRHAALKAVAQINGDDPEVTCLVRSHDGNLEDQLVDAVVSNQVRSDLKPSEEARAFARLKGERYSVKEIAERMGTTVKHVNARLELIDLSPIVTAALDNGTIGLSSVPVVKAITKVSPVLADLACLSAAEVDSSTVAWFNEHPLRYIKGSEAYEAGILINRNLPDAFPYTEKTVDARNELSALRGYPSYPTVPTKVIEEAIKIGVGYQEPAPEGRPNTAICDLEWLRDAVERATLTELRRERRLARERAAESGVEDGTPSAQEGEPLTEEQLAQAKREERLEQLAERLKAHAANEQLGIDALQKITAPERTRRAALDLVALVTRGDLRKIGAAAAFCLPQYAERKETKDGVVTYKYDTERAALDAYAFVAAGEDYDGVLARFLMLLTMASGVDQGAVANSNKVDVGAWPTQELYQPTIHSLTRGVRNAGTIKALDKRKSAVEEGVEAVEQLRANAEQAANTEQKDGE